MCALVVIVFDVCVVFLCMCVAVIDAFGLRLFVWIISDVGIAMSSGDEYVCVTAVCNSAKDVGLWLELAVCVLDWSVAYWSLVVVFGNIVVETVLVKVELSWELIA